ncbi:unnamed protein product [Fraxinus pennsylvanica]|uniref:RING-CH-type domain-containing protein n=1 Tax=Fraxinus pennsylvanica TaxID=56036 RepID=A0AAD2DPU2_9LAMI|nr:unnamed protein product [Fraxinus pennsylvanica]
MASLEISSIDLECGRRTGGEGDNKEEGSLYSSDAEDDDLAAVHRHCAETWFKIKGNKTCEICNSIARNVVGPNDIEAAQQTNGSNSTATNTASSAAAPMTTETRSCLNGHRFLNFLLACMVFAFVISWLFHFNIPS